MLKDGALKEFFENVGCDPAAIEQILVSSIEDAQIKILKTFAAIKELKDSLTAEDEQPKFLCVLDSLGALVVDKLLTDAEKDKVVSEMGGRAKKCNSMMKAITIPALVTDTSMLVLNHVYDDPSAMFASKIKNQSGGKGMQYMSTITVQCSRVLEKSKETTDNDFYSGTNLDFFTIKNRICRPSISCRIYLDFKKGFLNKYDGLFDDAVKYGLIECPAQGYYTVPSCDKPDKKWRKAQLEANEDIWKLFIDKFDELGVKDLKYSSSYDTEDDKEFKELVEKIKDKNPEDIKIEITPLSVESELN